MYREIVYLSIQKRLLRVLLAAGHLREGGRLVAREGLRKNTITHIYIYICICMCIYIYVYNTILYVYTCIT